MSVRRKSEHGFGVAKFSDEESIDGADIGKADDGDDDDFFLEDANTESGSEKKKRKKSKGKDEEPKAASENRMASTKEELELLIAGDDGELYVWISLVQSRSIRGC